MKGSLGDVLKNRLMVRSTKPMTENGSRTIVTQNDSLCRKNTQEMSLIWGHGSYIVMVEVCMAPSMSKNMKKARP